MYRIRPPYTDISLDDRSSCVVYVDDHMGGFGSVDKIPSIRRNIQRADDAKPIGRIEYVFDDSVMSINLAKI